MILNMTILNCSAALRDVFRLETKDPNEIFDTLRCIQEGKTIV